MNGDWTEISVAELQHRGVLLVEDGNHGENRPRPDEFVEDGVAFIRAADMHDGRVLFDRAERINDVAFRRIRKGVGAPGDVLLSHKGTVGKVAFVHSDAPPFVCSPQTTFWRCLDDRILSSRFLFAFLRSATFQSRLDALKGETDMADYVSLTTQRALTVPVPPIHEQRAIASVLGSLDDKIELNRRMNETLEAMARALFKSWFVDFDPVRAKMEGRAPAGMDAETAALFPDSFEASELEPIPKGWRITQLGDHLTLQRGTTYKSSLLGLPGPYLLGLASIQRNGGFRGDKLVTYGGESPDKLLLGPGDLYVSLKDVTQAGDLVGAVSRVPPYIRMGRLTQDTVKLSFVVSDVSAGYIYSLLRTPEYRAFCRARAIGTTNLSLAREDFLSYPILVPTPEVMRVFSAIEQSLCARQDVNISEALTLAELRDLLLPRLLSGELRVRDAEKLVEAAL